MYLVNISIDNRYPEPGQPIVLRTSTPQPFATRLKLYETDTYFDREGNERREGEGGLRHLATFDLRGDKRKFTEVKLVEMPDKPPPEGFFHGAWETLYICHARDARTLTAHRCTSRECHAAIARSGAVQSAICQGGDTFKGEITEATRDGKVVRALKLKLWSSMFSDGAHLMLLDDDTLCGHWWGDGEDPEKTARNPHRAWFLRRGVPRAEEIPGVTIPVRFDGWPDTFEVWVSEDELVRELDCALEEGITRLAGDHYLLEIGARYRRTAYDAPDRPNKAESKVVDTYLRHYAEYRMPYDRQVQEDLARTLLYQHAWLLGAGLGPGWEQVKRDPDIVRLAAILAPGKPEWWLEKEVADVWMKAVEQGRADHDDVRDSFFTRFAASGFEPGATENPFRGRDLHLFHEMEEYRSSKHLDYPDRDFFVELHERGWDDPQFPGRTWHFARSEPGPFNEYSSGARDFDRWARALFVPRGCAVEVVYGDWQVRRTLGPGRHSLWTEKEIPLAGLRVTWDDEEAFLSEPELTLAAYRRGRQLRRISLEAAVSPTAEVPSRLFDTSAMVGLAEEDVTAAFTQAYEAAREERRRTMVKTYCALGFDDKTPNPFDTPETRKQGEEVAEAQRILNDPAYAAAAHEGRALFDIRRHGLEQGRLAFKVPHPKKVITPAPPDFLERNAALAGVSLEIAERLYESAWTSGWEQRHASHVQSFFQRGGTQERIAEGVARIFDRLVAGEEVPYTGISAEELERLNPYVSDAVLVQLERPRRIYRDLDFENYPAPKDLPTADWSTYGDPYRTDWLEAGYFPGLVEAALENGVSRKVLDLMIRESLHRYGPTMREDHENRWVSFAARFVLNPLEWLGVSFWACIDAVTRTVSRFTDYVTCTDYALEYIEDCKRLSKLSAFHQIPSDGSFWGLWAFAVLGIGDAFLKVGTALTGAHVLSSWGTGARTFAGYMRTVMAGGLKQVAGNALRTLGKTVAVSAVAGGAEETISAAYEGRAVSYGKALGNTLRNSAMFLAFSGTGAFLKAFPGALAQTFASLAMLPMCTGMLATGAAVCDAWERDDPDAAMLAFKDLALQAITTLLVAGATGVTRILVRGKLAQKNPRLAPPAKVIEKLNRSATPVVKEKARYERRFKGKTRPKEEKKPDPPKPKVDHQKALQDEADEILRTMNRNQQPGTICTLETTSGQTFKGRSAKGKRQVEAPPGGRVRQLLDEAEAKGLKVPGHGKCAEIDALIQAEKLGIDVKGATIRTARVRAPQSNQAAFHGKPHNPCCGCEYVLGKLEVQYVGE